MKMTHQATLPGLLLLMAGMALANPALAGEVYKCVDGGSTVYQDLPCPSNPDQEPRQRFASSFEGADDGVAAPPRPVAPPLGPSKEQLTSLYANLHQAEQDRDRIEKDYQNEVTAAQERNKSNKLAADNEVRAINQRWSAQSQEVFQRQQSLAAQAAQMCPNSKEITSDGVCR